MKLCRFDLVSEPGNARSGIVHEGKVYETDGMRPIAIHDSAETRLLAPIGRPPAIRMFTGNRTAVEEFLQDQGAQPTGPEYIYLNPGLMQGPNVGVPGWPLSSEIGVKLCLAAVVGAEGKGLVPSEAEEGLLGVCLAAVLYAADIERNEKAACSSLVRSHEVGIFVGPALTTFDELEEARIESDGPSRYAIELRLDVGNSPILQTSTAEVPYALGELAAELSRSAPLQAGELFLTCHGATGPHAQLTPGDEVRLYSPQLGALAFRYG